MEKKYCKNMFDCQVCAHQRLKINTSFTMKCSTRACNSRRYAFFMKLFAELVSPIHTSSITNQISVKTRSSISIS